RANADFVPVQLFQRHTDRSGAENALSNAQFLHLNATSFDALLHAAPAAMVLDLPTEDGGTATLELIKTDIKGTNFHVGTLGQNAQDAFPVHPDAHYRGVLRGDPNSVAAVSLTSSGFTGMYSNASGTWQIGEMEDDSDRYVLYRTADLLGQNPAICGAEALEGTTPTTDESGSDDRSAGCKTVTVYFECDYKLYQDKGSNVNNVTSYVTSLFNQVAALYANENIGIAISEIYVWTSPDPYQSQTSTSGVLNAFRTNKGTNFNGNLAHFLSTRSLGGGIAYVDVICVKQFAFGVSAISTSFQNVPTYSWSVEVVTHELGHNLGSWHTHSCSWPNGALDNCVSPEGSCSPGPAPTNGGTIMSYCHLTSYGINFNNGFGTVPGNHIRSKVAAASCVSTTGAAPSGLNASNVTANAASLSWTAVAGATNYTLQYKSASGSTWTTAGPFTAANYALSGLTASTAYQWQVKTDCSQFSTVANFTTTATGGGGSNCSAPTNLGASNVTSTSAVLAWAAVSGATSYTVDFKLSTATTWTVAGNSTTSAYNMSGLTAGTTYMVRVKANCSGYSTASSFTTTSSGGGGTCSAPGGLFTNSVTNSGASLVWQLVSGATDYTVQLKTSTSNTWNVVATTSGTTTNIGGLTAGTTYNWRVKASCSNYSASANFTTTGSNGGSCAAPTNLVNVSVGGSQAVISWGASSGAINYTLQLKYANGSTWYTLGTVTSTQVLLSGLQTNTAYHWRVKANCSAYSTTKLLTTGNGNFTTDPGVNGLDLTVLRFTEGNLSLSPNPSSGWVNIGFTGDMSEKTSIRILDVTGREVLLKTTADLSEQLDISTLLPGVYMVVLEDNGQRKGVQRLVVSE
ncbi:MAG: fibronectin type III domain-containing protein, partial [Saprospiraceae bacterium]|nr:fibronectin type III domain-containing protein [Saprospiraceae bacterium]